VTTDALTVQWGQAMGQTGRYQAASWFGLYASGVLTGAAGGLFSQAERTRTAFAVCGASAVGVFALAAAGLREPGGRPDRAPARQTARVLWRAARSRAVLAVAALTAVANFNPFSSALLQHHMTGALGLSESFYGGMLSVLALASMAAAAGYGLYCRRWPMARLARASVALGVVGTLSYAAMADARSAVLVTVVSGFASMTALLIVFDLAARACPTEAAGTTFATLMALANLSTTLATWLVLPWLPRQLLEEAEPR
jgi:predicted MFS family arabinose efflux permease